MSNETKSPAKNTSLPTQAHVVIIGGGVIGCSIAYHLTKLGWKDVILLEKAQLTAGTTWHAAGLVVTPSGDELSVELSTYTVDLIKSIEKETGQATGFKDIGYLQLACTPDWLEERRRMAAVGSFSVGDGDLFLGDIETILSRL